MDLPNLTDDEDFMELVNIVTYNEIRRKIFCLRIYRPRKNCFEYFDDEEFLRRYRLPKECVKELANSIAQKIASVTNWNYAVTVEQQLLVTLRYYATGNILQAVGDFHGIHKTTTSKIIKRVSRALARLSMQYINMPNTDEEMITIVNGFYQISRFPCCLGALDCTHIKIQSPGGNEAEIYRNRKDYFSLNCQAVCDANLIIRDIVCRWPGSSHDSTIFNNSNLRARFERGDFKNYVILGDSGYPIKPYLITPLRNPVTHAKQLFNESQIRTRNPIERCFGVIKRRFPILSNGIKVNIEIVEAIVVATVVLHNIAILMNLPEIPSDDFFLEDAMINEQNDEINVQEVNRVNNFRRLAIIRDHFSRIINLKIHLLEFV